MGGAERACQDHAGESFLPLGTLHYPQFSTATSMAFFEPALTAPTQPTPRRQAREEIPKLIVLGLGINQESPKSRPVFLGKKRGGGIACGEDPAFRGDRVDAVGGLKQRAPTENRHLACRHGRSIGRRDCRRIVPVSEPTDNQQHNLTSAPPDSIAHMAPLVLSLVGEINSPTRDGTRHVSRFRNTTDSPAANHRRGKKAPPDPLK